MSYIAHEFFYDATRATLWGYIQIALINMGWELHDNISATVKVYKSNGESGNEPYGYIWIDAGTSTYIQFYAYQYWNSTTHAGVRPRYSNDSATVTRITATYIQANNPGLIAGDKNIVVISGDAYNTSLANSAVVFGHIPVRYDNNITNAQGTAGTAGTITIASSAGMGDGKNIQIVGAEGCDSIAITSAPDATTRKLIALPRNYGTGAVVGAPASVFGITTAALAFFYPVSIWGDAGTTVGTGAWTIAILSSPNLGSVLYFNERKYLTSPIFVYSLSATTPGAAIGTFGQYIISSITPAAGDSLISNNDDSFPSVSMVTGVTANTLSDSSKSWAVNEHAGRFCIISYGPGISAVKLISSNTADTLTLDSNWGANFTPSGGSEYKIADIVRRGTPSLIATAAYIQLTRTDVPT